MKAQLRAWRLYAALGATAIATYYLLPRGGVAQAAILTTTNATAAAAALSAAVRTSRLNRLVWLALGSAMVLATLANAPYYVYPLLTGQHLPFPGPVDVLWLLMYPCFVAALLALGKQRGGNTKGDILDAAIITVAGGTLMWVFILGPIMQTPAETTLEHIVSAAYPAMDLVVFAFLVSLLLSGLGRSGASRLLLASFTTLLAADMVYALGLLNGTYAIGGPTDGMWVASYVLIGAAAMHPAARAFPRRINAGAAMTRGRLAFLSTAVLAGPALLIFDGKDVAVVAVTSALSFLLVMLRLTGLNWRLASLGAELEAQAATDALTGLLNRTAFSNATAAALRDRNDSVAMVMIDLDDFKRVNDLAGHSAGDAILSEVAQRMRGVGRSTDVMGRLGGDEFAVLIKGQADPQRLGDRLVDALQMSYQVGDRLFTIGASVGYALAGEDAEAERLFREADIALYAAKDRGKNRVVGFKQSMYTAIVEHTDLAHELETALKRNEITLEYQAVVRLHDEQIVGFEALARWDHPRLGRVPPSRFIPVAEASGAIVPIGRWILRAALYDLTKINNNGANARTVSVNVSAVQLMDPSFAYDVGAALDVYGVRGEQLVLEITEGALIDDNSVAVRHLRNLHNLGIRIAIDDFGTGYSSLAYLQRLPVTELKIDRLFVDGIDNGRAGVAPALAVIRMCEALGLRCIAEGVEREAQAGVLRGAGCDSAQGFLFGRPVPIEEALKLICTPDRPGQQLAGAA